MTQSLMPMCARCSMYHPQRQTEFFPSSRMKESFKKSDLANLGDIRGIMMGKFDEAIISALAQAITSSVQELDASSGTAQEHICWIKMNFIKHFTEDVLFLNDHSSDNAFSRRYGNLIIRDMLEQLIEFLYLLKNPHLAEEYLGLTIDFQELNRKKSVIKREELFGDKRYNKGIDGRPSVADMATDIGEKSSGNENLTLYKLYKILSERCHNAYFSSLLDDVNKVHHSISTGGLSEGQTKDVLIMIAIVLGEFKYNEEK